MTIYKERRAGWLENVRYQQLVELAPDAILVHDGERVVLANTAAVKLAGATDMAQLVGLPIDTFLDPPYLKAVESQLANTISSSALAPPVRDTFRRIDGTTVEVEVRASAFLDHDHPAVHLVLRDITERLAVELARHQMGERLQEAQRMESVGALAGGVAHEVNNMMQVVLGFSDFLIGDGHLPPAAAADVREIIRAANRAAAVSRQLLAFSRRDIHRPTLVDPAAALREAETMIRRLLGEERTLVLTCEPAPQIWVDGGQLQQVIINLALNARDAMPTRGTLTITLTEVEQTVRAAAAGGAVIPPGRYALLRVTDTGCGMDSALQAKIFEPFFTTKPVGEGTGLGLAAALGALTQNNGYITVVSAPGAGTTFSVYLPAVPAEEVAESVPADPGSSTEAPGTGALILVVEDEPAVRTIAARMLERSGYRVLLASNGKEALDLVDRHGPPQLVLTDLMMPDISGAELGRRLNQRWPALPLVFMSGHTPEELYWPGAVGGRNGLLKKPFTLAGLLLRVTEALTHSSMVGPMRLSRSRAGLRLERESS